MNNTIVLMMRMSVPEWVLHLLETFNSNYNEFYNCVISVFANNPTVEIDEIIPDYAFDFAVWEEVSCWHYLSSQLLLKVALLQGRREDPAD